MYVLRNNIKCQRNYFALETTMFSLCGAVELHATDSCT